MARAEAADAADIADGLSIPDELARREDRWGKLAEARAKIEARAKERFEREAAEHCAKLAAREAKAAATGKKPGGKPPAPPVEGAQRKDQINLTASPRPAVLQSRRAPELSRLAVAPTLRHSPFLPGHTLTAPSTTARLVRSG